MKDKILKIMKDRHYNFQNYSDEQAFIEGFEYAIEEAAKTGNLEKIARQSSGENHPFDKGVMEALADLGFSDPVYL